MIHHPFFRETLFVSLFLLLASAFQVSNAQQASTYSDLPRSTPDPATIQQNGTVRFLALMVEFQPDTNAYTTGDGTFHAVYLDTTENIVLDPLPHDQNYFEAHLTFAKNYFETMSDGQLTLDFMVVPEVIRLDQEMKAYSPIGPGNDENFKLADLVRDSWTAADERGALDGIDVSQYSGFILFHAGAGRDFDYLGTTLDKTPQDIPSLYLDRDALSELTDDNQFQGFPIQNGQAMIDNALILPQTESRTGELLGDPFVLQLSINGLVTATIGNHLGLPDLFNTQDGNSAIGRFGLMDPEGFFAYSGLFPPAMSAWERIHMGWADPVVVRSDRALTLPAATLFEPNSIARVDINPNEYFLIENRHRDPDDNGVTLTIQKPDGSLVEQTFQNTDRRFAPNNVDSLAEVLEPGVVVDVSNYDWALPGGQYPGDDGDFDTDDDFFLNGGMLIWHIDDQVIRNNLARGRGININPLHRGVDLEEADGAQDIGRSTGDIFLQNVIGGTPYDFWWSGNDYTVITETNDSLRVFEDRFGPGTQPGNESYGRQSSSFEFTDFSDTQPRATVNVRMITIDRPYSIDTAWANADVPVYQQNVNITEEDEIFPKTLQWTEGGLLVPADKTVHLSEQPNGTVSAEEYLFSYISPLYSDDSPFSAFLTRESGQSSYQFNFAESSFNGLTPNSVTQLSTPEISTSHLLLPFEDRLLLAGTNVSFDRTDQSLETDQAPQFSAQFYNGTRANLFADRIEWGSNTIQLPEYLYSEEHTGLFYAVEVGLNQTQTALLSDEMLAIFNTDGQRMEIELDSAGHGTLALSDINMNGLTDYILQQPHELRAINHNGGTVADLVINPPKYHTFIHAPLISDINNDDTPNIITSTRDSSNISYLIAYNNDGSVVNGFPIETGRYSEDRLQIFPIIHDQSVFTVDADGRVHRFAFDQMKNTEWPTVYGNYPDQPLSYHLGDELNAVLDQPVLSLNKEETYNWPNPATDITHIRYSTTTSTEVDIHIIDMTGRTVFERTVTSQGLAPEELMLDVSDWGSGVYFVKVEAWDQSKLFKMAVVR